MDLNLVNHVYGVDLWHVYIKALKLIGFSMGYVGVSINDSDDEKLKGT
jgi:hypothetical protein